MLTALQHIIRPENLIISDSQDLATSLFEAHGMLEAVAHNTLVKVEDLDNRTVLRSQVIGLKS